MASHSLKMILDLHVALSKYIYWNITSTDNIASVPSVCVVLGHGPPEEGAAGKASDAAVVNVVGGLEKKWINVKMSL